jgi:hypothetical protein
VSVTATGGRLRLDIRRSGRDSARVALVGGRKNLRIRLRGTDIAEGVPALLRVSLYGPTGASVGHYAMSVCPYRGLDHSVVGLRCGYPGLTRRYVATFLRASDQFVSGQARPIGASPLVPPTGRYRAEVSFDPAYVPWKQRGADDKASLSMVVGGPGDSLVQQPPVGRRAPRRRRAEHPHLPDLIPAAPEQLRVEPLGTREYLRFDSLFWNRSQVPLILRGHRTSTSTMTTVQRIPGRYGGSIRHPAGAYRFDRRRGHGHWHYRSAARYELIGRHGHVLRKSAKVGFCISDSTPIAIERSATKTEPDSHDVCARHARRSLEMHLNPGWGDLYVQSLPGQAFNISRLPDGIYGLKVTVNPLGAIAEATRANNSVVRLFRLIRQPDMTSARWLRRPAHWR